MGPAHGIVWVGHLGDDFFNNLLLVLAAVAVAGSVGIAFAGESEGAGAVDVLIEAFIKHALPALQLKSLVGIDINAAEGVHDFDNSLEADLDGIVNLNAEQILDSIFAHFDAVDAGVGEFVLVAGGAVKLDVIIARDGNQEDAGGFWIDDRHDIDIAAGGLGDGATRVGARKVDGERFGGDVNGLAKIWGVGADLELVNHASVVDESRVGVLGEII